LDETIDIHPHPTDEDFEDKKHVLLNSSKDVFNDNLFIGELSELIDDKINKMEYNNNQKDSKEMTLMDAETFKNQIMNIKSNNKYENNDNNINDSLIFNKKENNQSEQRNDNREDNESRLTMNFRNNVLSVNSNNSNNSNYKDPFIQNRPYLKYRYKKFNERPLSSFSEYSSINQQ